MVVPAEQRKVVWVVIPTVVSLQDVVRFQPIPAVAAVNGAGTLVPFPDQGSDGGWDRLAQIRNADQSTVVARDDDSDFAGTEDLREGVGSDSGSGRQGDARFAVRRGGEGGVDEDIGDGDGSTFGAGGEAIGADRGEGIGHSLRPVHPFQLRKLVGSLS